MNFWETLLIAFIPAILTGVLAYVGYRLDYLKYRSESMAERSARKYLKHKGYTDRKFETILKRLGGYDDNPDELRRILVRAGAERLFKNKEEYWTLISRQKERIEKIRNKTN
ncbi:hypothetical protein F3C99_11435 [Vitellibacter sp. q18]|nr:hypothetical protein [Aequorivita lutea]